jgi:hypothetical protein
VLMGKPAASSVSQNVYQSRMPDDSGKLDSVVYLPMEQQSARSKTSPPGEERRVRPRPELRATIWALTPSSP